MNPKQKKFCDEYLKNGGNATQAAIKAGYSKKTANRIASENLSKLDIKNYIQERSKKLEEEFHYSIQEHFKDLQEVAALAKEQGNLAVVLKSIELQGKVVGHYVEKKQVNGDINVNLTWGNEDD